MTFMLIQGFTLSPTRTTRFSTRRWYRKHEFHIFQLTCNVV